MNAIAGRVLRYFFSGTIFIVPLLATGPYHRSTLKEVRDALVEQQRRMARDKAVVMDGRDIGTVVFPNAELKLFMTADILVRAFRRQKELLQRGQLVDLDDVIENLIHRDKIDTSRAESPLRQADDALVIDTTHITIDEQVDEVVRQALSKSVAV